MIHTDGRPTIANGLNVPLTPREVFSDVSGTKPVLRTPDGVPEGWYIAVEDDVPVLRKCVVVKRTYGSGHPGRFGNGGP